MSEPLSFPPSRPAGRARTRSLRAGWRTLSVAILLGAVPTPAGAQNPVWTMTAPANPDHSSIAQGVPVVSRYEFEVTPQGGSPRPPLDIGKPALVPSCTMGAVTVQNCIVVDVNTFVNALPPGTYTGVVRALGPGGSVMSPAGPPFPLTVPAPGPQGAPGVSKSSTSSPLAPRKK